MLRFFLVDFDDASRSTAVFDLRGNENISSPNFSFFLFRRKSTFTGFAHALNNSI